MLAELKKRNKIVSLKMRDINDEISVTIDYTHSDSAKGKKAACLLNIGPFQVSSAILVVPPRIDKMS